ncbi:ferredoxin [Acrocarpospora pleiomorpha]|uniref:Ferredoxin n=1 Tax=Acrocarpospora pleiomorpha TaxID=90975 RepID=A0A5M3XMS8_9ACTN|nr:ferredoxin [Acrocarpospora pleiomorpha]
MSARQALVIGAGQAGLHLAESLRAFGFEGSVLLAGAEKGLPYQRPPLSKEFLLAESAAPTVLRSKEFLKSRGITLLDGHHIVSVRRDAGGGEARDSTGRAWAFTHLALATGASSRVLDLPGAGSPSVRYLRDLAHARRLRNAARSHRVRRIAIIGGGFIGLELAAAMTALGKSVTVLEVATTVLARAVDQRISRHVEGALLNRDVDLRCGVQPVAVLDSPSGATEVLLGDGTTVSADLVIAGIGATPRTEIAESLGLACDPGIVVDGRNLASDNRTVAAGDCTQPERSLFNPLGIRLESVNNAVTQARIGAATLAGVEPPTPSVPWFWSVIGDIRLQMAGMPPPGATADVQGDPSSGSFSIVFHREATLVAVQCVNDPARFAAGRKAIQRGSAVRPGQKA